MNIYCLFVLIALCYYRSTLAQNTTIQLQNNQISSSSIAIGSYNYYYFSVPSTTQIFSKRALPNILLSITTCAQPVPPATFQGRIPSLNVYISNSQNNTLPGPDNGITVEDTINGLTTWMSNNDTLEIWIAVGTEELANTWTGNWSYEIGVSTNQIMHPIFVNLNKNDTLDQPYLVLDDTDRDSALLLSSTFSGNQPNTSVLMASNLPTDLSYSLCAAKLHSLTNYSVNMTITYRGVTNATRQQFFVSGLTQASTYIAYMVQNMGSVQGITTPVSVSTKISANCKIIYDLPFCDQVAYSVPANPGTLASESIWDLASQYDNQALQTFQPFGTSLSQFNCNSTQYSLVRNCSDCYRDYKTWLCSVTIPRCTDSSASADLTQGTDNVKSAPALRDISVNASRNPWVDKTIVPGEWTELLPCIDLCYHVVQSCPPFLQFFCPDSDLANVQYGYWQIGNASVNGRLYTFDINNPTCNRMGVDPSLLTINAGYRSQTINLVFVALLSCLTSLMI